MMQTALLTQPSKRTARAYLLGGAAAGVVLAAFVVPRVIWPALLVVGLYLLGIMLGSTLFLALQNLCQARWSRSIEFVPRLLAAMTPWTLVILLPVLTLGLPTLYEWSHAGDSSHAGHGPLHGFKAVWLEPAFFWVRTAIYIGAWWLLSRRIARESSSTPSRSMRWAALFVVVFAVTWVASSFDWIMSIDSHWFSTIFGVYNFAGMFVSALAATTLILILHARATGGTNAIRPEQLHDLGRLIFGFSCFWAYIWYSQYMLIWYSNLPEETGYYALRHSGVWQTVSFLNVICNWVVPFIVLLSSTSKRNPATLAAVCIVLMIGRALDLSFMILPPFTGNSILGVALGVVPAAAGLALLATVVNRSIRIAPAAK
ncbi:MAG TPA: hypothetical protein PL151_18750 [Phycisphaerae bacterium]|nr:hypothetical protein [Phycisphaerae bacterium]HOM53468.1 hypothetical protein [Phycisphaerae bacterium]HOQ86350.1 hypothetical protein [Phycisphaerae bacterium]HPP27514.1 hypothetical protein [Phycisphaerae bacterium]HPU26096.1 hypothetical protein [Phycisphaerae bacterium]